MSLKKKTHKKFAFKTLFPRGSQSNTDNNWILKIHIPQGLFCLEHHSNVIKLMYYLSPLRVRWRMTREWGSHSPVNIALPLYRPTNFYWFSSSKHGLATEHLRPWWWWSLFLFAYGEFLVCLQFNTANVKIKNIKIQQGVSSHQPSSVVCFFIQPWCWNIAYWHSMKCIICGSGHFNDNTIHISLKILQVNLETHFEMSFLVWLRILSVLVSVFSRYSNILKTCLSLI